MFGLHLLFSPLHCLLLCVFIFIFYISNISLFGTWVFGTLFFFLFFFGSQYTYVSLNVGLWGHARWLVLIACSTAWAFFSGLWNPGG